MGKKLALIHKINSLLILIVGLQFAFSVDAVSQKLHERKKSDISYKSKEKSTKKETKKKKDVKGTKKTNDPAPRAKTPTGGAKVTPGSPKDEVSGFHSPQ